MQSFCDLETEQMTAARFGTPENTPATQRASWLDRLVRRFAPVPVDHMPIVPAHAHAEPTPPSAPTSPSVSRPLATACCSRAA